MYIDQMIWNRLTINDIVIKIFTGAYIHSTINLPGVCADNLPAEFEGKMSGKSSLAACSWPGNGK